MKLIIYFLYDLCLKIRYKDAKYQNDILSLIKSDDDKTDKQLIHYIDYMSKLHKTEIITVHNLLQKSNYPNLRSRNSIITKLQYI